MIFHLPVYGVMDCNCYAFVDGETAHGFLFDPGAQGHELAEFIHEKGWIIEKILLTHSHFDHIGGVPALRKKLGLPVFVHENGPALLAEPKLNLSAYHGEPLSLTANGTFRDGDLLTLADGSLSLRVLHTPGHTADSCIFYSKAAHVAFVGDTIFKGTYGATHFPTGDEPTILRSIREKVLTLPADTLLLPGHGEATMVEGERELYA